ncbi:UNVERIFIED_CONTAM: hypothetical protein PYX00_002047 [Menopon gallinae]|uniref:Uncharacterized protein n=1 Tax=Menopon gallinae TaxID=328185 RepID=A0AAW2IF93_9NEOP
MPFIQRTVQPKHLSQKSLFDENGRSLVSDFELEAVTNNTLSNVLRQLASLVLVANDIFEDLARQLQDVHERSTKLKASIHLLEDKLTGCDPKTVTVREYNRFLSFSRKKKNRYTANGNGGKNHALLDVNVGNIMEIRVGYGEKGCSLGSKMADLKKKRFPFSANDSVLFTCFQGEVDMDH